MKLPLSSGHFAIVEVNREPKLDPLYSNNNIIINDDGNNDNNNNVRADWVASD